MVILCLHVKYLKSGQHPNYLLHIFRLMYVALLDASSTWQCRAPISSPLFQLLNSNNKGILNNRLIFHNFDHVQGVMNLIVFEVYIPLVKDPHFLLLNLQSFSEDYFTNLFLRLLHIRIVILIVISSSLILIDGSYSFEWPGRCHHDVNFCHRSVTTSLIYM